jgi:hypothetical protein
MIFISAPYSSKDPAETEMKMKFFLAVDAYFTKIGIHTVSPLYKHILVKASHEVPGDWKFWKDYSIELLKTCTTMVIVPYPGWEESTGVQGEIEACKQLGIRYYVFDLNKLTK